MTLSFTMPESLDLSQLPFELPMPVPEFVATVLVSAALLLTLTVIWRGRARHRRAVASVTRAPELPQAALALNAQAEASRRAFRKSGAMKSVKVTTPVSKMATKVLKRLGTDPKEIAKVTGLSRDAVMMMMAQNGATAHITPRAVTALAAAPATEPTTAARTTARHETATMDLRSSNRPPARPAAAARATASRPAMAPQVAPERVMLAPGAGIPSLRTPPRRISGPVGTRLNTRIG